MARGYLAVFRPWPEAAWQASKQGRAPPSTDCRPWPLELLETLADSGAGLYACQMATEMFKLKREDLAPQVKAVISAMGFFDKSAGAQVIFI